MNRLSMLRKQKQETQEDIAKLLNLTRKAISFYELGQRDIPNNTLQKLADHFHVSTDYLLGREPEMYGKKLNAKFPFIALPKDRNYIPVLGTVRCGLNAPSDEHIEEYIGIDDKYRADEMCAFRAEGDSMEGDYIFDGDICLVHLQEEVPDGAIAVCVIDGIEGTMKHVHRNNGVIVLQASNPKYSPNVYAGEDANRIRIVGEVVEVRRSLKK